MENLFIIKNELAQIKFNSEIYKHNQTRVADLLNTVTKAEGFITTVSDLSWVEYFNSMTKFSKEIHVSVKLTDKLDNVFSALTENKANVINFDDICYWVALLEYFVNNFLANCFLVISVKKSQEEKIGDYNNIVDEILSNTLTYSELINSIIRNIKRLDQLYT